MPHAAAAAGSYPVPPLVQVLAGSSVTGVMVLSCLLTTDTRALRQLHPAVAGVVGSIPWRDTQTRVKDVVRWRAALPAAVGVKLVSAPKASDEVAALEGVACLDLSTKEHPPLWRLSPWFRSEKPTVAPSLAHLTALTSLDCSRLSGVANLFPDMSSLPPSLRELRMDDCDIAATADFHLLGALRVLSVAGSEPSSSTLASLPPSLQELDVSRAKSWPRAASLAHLHQLKVLRAAGAPMNDYTLTSMPSSLVDLSVAGCCKLTFADEFWHLHALRVLDVSSCDIWDELLASLPPSLVSLDASQCAYLTPAATLSHLPLLRVLNVGGTAIGDATVASLPAGLEELNISECGGVTPAATLVHLPALRSLQSIGTNLSRAVTAGCRARGCHAPADGMLRGHRELVLVLALLPDGRLASGDVSGRVRLWDLGREDEPAVVFKAGRGEVRRLVALPHCRGLAVSCYDSAASNSTGKVVVWDLERVRPERWATVVCSERSVSALVALHDGRLAAGSYDGNVLIIDADEGVVVDRLEVEDPIWELLVLPNGFLACGCDACVQVWDVDGGGDAVVLEAPSRVFSMAVLPDGRLAFGLGGGKVQLWDLGTRTCVGTFVPVWNTGLVCVLVALPDGRLASVVGGIGEHAIWLYDMRPAAAVPTAAVVRSLPPPSMLARLPGENHPALLLLPDGRLVSAQRGGCLQLFAVPPAPAVAAVAVAPAPLPPA